MKFEEGEIVRIKPGSNDHGHGGELGIVVRIRRPVTGPFSIAGQVAFDDVELYEVGFPPENRWLGLEGFPEDQLEGVKVFISHDEKDSLLAKDVASALRDAGFKDVFYDRSVLPGDNWAEKISEALNSSVAMVVLLTQQALESSVVRREIGFALGKESYKKRLIPVIVGGPEKVPEERIPWILKRLKVIKIPERGNDGESLKKIALALKEAA